MTEAELSEAMTRLAAREMDAFRAADMVDRASPGRGGGRKRSGSWTITDYRDCAERGMSVKETARALKVSDDAAYYMKKTYAIPFKDGRGKHPRQVVQK